MKNNLTKAAELLREHFLPLADIAEYQLEEFLSVKELRAGEEFIVNGELQSYCLFVINGKVEQLSNSGSAKILNPIDSNNKPICTDKADLIFKAHQDSLFATVNLTRLDFLLGWINFSQTQEKNSAVNSWLESIQSPMIFKHLPLENVQKVYERFEDVSVKAGEDIVVQGEPGDYFYMIEEGEAEVWQSGIYDDDQELVATLSSGQQFGEDALIMKGNRNATVKMSTNGRLKRLDSKDFNELLNSPMEERVSNKIAHAMLEEDTHLLDVRYEEEFEMESIPGAKLIPLHELRDRMDELNPDNKYIVYCHAGPRSAVATYLLNNSGFNAVCMIGGIRDWSYEMVSE